MAGSRSLGLLREPERSGASKGSTPRQAPYGEPPSRVGEVARPAHPLQLGSPRLRIRESGDRPVATSKAQRYGSRKWTICQQPT